MITGSVVLVLVAVALLVAGLISGSHTLYYSSIVASVLAAFALMAGVRQLPVAQLPEDDFDVGRIGPDIAPRPRPTGRAGVPRQARASVDTDGHDLPALDDSDDHGDRDDRDDRGDRVAEPQDEPAIQDLTAAVAARLARLDADVVVVNGRPRYHVAGCLHLLGRTIEVLPLAEAAELGFTPCAQCEVGTVLLADAE